jgi:hypothetical protein
MDTPEPRPKMTRVEKDVIAVLDRLRNVVSGSVGFQSASDQALERATRSIRARNEDIFARAARTSMHMA